MVPASCWVQSPVGLESISSLSRADPALCTSVRQPAVLTHDEDSLHSWQVCASTAWSLRSECAGQGSFPVQIQYELRETSTLAYKYCVFHNVLCSKTVEQRRWPSLIGMHYGQSVLLSNGQFLKIWSLFFLWPECLLGGMSTSLRRIDVFPFTVGDRKSAFRSCSYFTDSTWRLIADPIGAPSAWCHQEEERFHHHTSDCTCRAIHTPFLQIIVFCSWWPLFKQWVKAITSGSP